MAIPIAANTTCDIYRSGVAPPAAPSVAGIACHLTGNYGQGVEAGELAPGPFRFSHVLLVDAGVDVRDDYNAGVIGTAMDALYVPDKNGTPFKIVFVERRLKGTPLDHKKVYLSRQTVTWPTYYL